MGFAECKLVADYIDICCCFHKSFGTGGEVAATERTKLVRCREVPGTQGTEDRSRREPREFRMEGRGGH